MAKTGQRKCLCCKDFFDPDPRNINRQRNCSNAGCRLSSKRASQAAGLAQSQNSDYFCGPGARPARAGLAACTSRLSPRQTHQGSQVRGVTRLLDCASA